jgi:hypothetical protein
MYTVPVAGAWWHAVGAPLERGVRQHSGGSGLQALCSLKDGLHVLEANRCRRVLVDDSENMPTRLQDPRKPILHSAEWFTLCGQTCVCDDCAYDSEIWAPRCLDFVEGDLHLLGAKRSEPGLDCHLPRCGTLI